MDVGQSSVEANLQKNAEYAPAIVFIIIVIILGIFGNTLSVTFYGFKVTKTCTNFLITALASIDLVTCVILIGEVLELCYSVDFQNRAGCKVMYFLNYWLVLTSGFMLLVIALDRYLRICRPFQKQISIKFARIIILTIAIFCGLLSSRNLFIIDVIEVNITRKDLDVVNNTNTSAVLTGFYCTHTKDPSLQTAALIFHLIDMICFVCIIFGSSLLYVIISYRIFKHRKKQSVKRKISRLEDSTTSFSKEECVRNTEKGPCDENETSQSDYITTDNTNPDIERSPVAKPLGSRRTVVDIVKSYSFRNRKKSQRGLEKENYKLEKKVTIMMLCVFIVSAVSFVPHFVINMIMKSEGEVSEQELSVGYQIALRLFILNNAVNPYIMGVFNTRFRNYVKQVVCKCTVCRR